MAMSNRVKKKKVASVLTQREDQKQIYPTAIYVWCLRPVKTGGGSVFIYRKVRTPKSHITHGLVVCLRLFLVARVIVNRRERKKEATITKNIH